MITKRDRKQTDTRTVVSYAFRHSVALSATDPTQRPRETTSKRARGGRGAAGAAYCIGGAVYVDATTTARRGARTADPGHWILDTWTDAGPTVITGRMTGTGVRRPAWVFTAVWGSLGSVPQRVLPYVGV